LDGVGDGFGGELGVEAGEGSGEALVEGDVSVVGSIALGAIGGEVGAVDVAPADGLEPLKGEVFELGFSDHGDENYLATVYFSLSEMDSGGLGLEARDPSRPPLGKGRSGFVVRV
jgi:hypothetical protein